MLTYYLSMVETEEQKEKVEYIFENLYSFMYSIVKKQLRNDKDADDIVQDTMLKVIDIIDTIDMSDTDRVKNLCGVMAKNKAIDFLRVKSNHSEPLDDIVEFTHVQDDETASTVISKETYALLLKAIDSLSDTYKEACSLKFVNELKEREIAKVLGISEKAVSLRIFRGRQLLREAIRKEKLHD